MTITENYRVNDAIPHWNVSGTEIIKYSVKVEHFKLNEMKILSSPEFSILKNKVNNQISKWEEMYNSLDLLEKASLISNEAKKRLSEIDDILKNAIDKSHILNFETLKENQHFNKEKPFEPALLVVKEFTEEEPLKENYKPKFDFWDEIFKIRRTKKIDLWERIYKKKYDEWLILKQKNEKENIVIIEENNKRAELWKNDVRTWEEKQNTFYQKQSRFNQEIDNFKNNYNNKDKYAIEKYCLKVLQKSDYPFSYEKEIEIEYNEQNEILLVEYSLPPFTCFPKIKEVKYIKSRDEMKEYFLSDTVINKLFDNTMYQIVLRSLYELFQADSISALKAINFNGWIKSINKGTGKQENTCILSIFTKKEEFLDINLGLVDPKICFQSLKGVGSTKLSGITPIKPIMRLNKTDNRFIDSYDVVKDVNSATNLAAMNWEDFEHLIREIFEKEFSENGGEVKITQASRDGGVDAIAFDPDPIRGGKIVIQAKRYTNTVGVSAVRDLYGTVVNEGAIKGILVSTANFGSEAYNFAKDKPITLLNGSNLLHLLEKHGHRAKIDLKEAKLILAEEKNNWEKNDMGKNLSSLQEN